MHLFLIFCPPLFFSKYLLSAYYVPAGCGLYPFDWHLASIISFYMWHLDQYRQYTFSLFQHKTQKLADIPLPTNIILAPSLDIEIFLQYVFFQLWHPHISHKTISYLVLVEYLPWLMIMLAIRKTWWIRQGEISL